MTATASREQKAHALGLWAAGHRQIERRVHWQRQEQYEAAIAATVALLQQFTPFDELVASYFASAVDDACQAACDATGVALNAGIVEDAAYWQRCEELRQGTSTTPSE